MNTTHRLRQTAQHEVLHGLLIMEAQGTVEEVRVSPGQVVARLPCTPQALTRHYVQYPYSTQRDLTRIVAAIIGPFVVLGGSMHEEDGDADLLREWQTGWEAARGLADSPGPAWIMVLHNARAFVREWYAEDGRQEQVAALAEVLMARRVLRGEAWRKLVDEHPVQCQMITPNLRPEHVLYGSSWRDYTSGVGYPRPLVRW